jgi:hypothetical protein
VPRGVYDRSALRPEEGNQPQSADYQPSPRAEEMRRERRRRDDGDLDRMARQKLAVPREVEERLKAEGKVWRWFLDEPGRQIDAHNDDWDAVEGVKPVSAGQSEETRLVLMSKFKDWHQADISRDETQLEDREKAIEAGKSSENRSADLVIPHGQRNRITHERG